jgi:uncharacterized protein (DUF983 family)
MNQHHTHWPAEAQVEPDRSKLKAALRGLRCRCPACGDGHLFKSFTKPVESCSSCGAEMHHQRADDFPAYVVTFIVGHLIVAAYLGVELIVTWSPMTHMVVWMLAVVILSVALLQPVKGAIIGLQWALRMHGFGGADDDQSDKRF